jgi:hypothetical protein
MSTTETPVYVEISFEQPGSASAVWGSITGTLSNQTDLQNALNLKVPYTGATTNVNLGEYELKAGQVTLDTSPTGTAAVGTTRWNDTIGSSETTLKGGNVILKNGVDLVARVVNKVTPNTTLTKAAYQAVRVSGAQGQRLAVAFAQANNDNNSADTIGLVIETIATNQEGFIMTVGQIEGINTTGSLQGETWNDGDIIYLSPTIAGAVTNVKPSGGQHLVIIGYVEYAHANNGRLYIKISNGWELTELHDVDVVSPANNEALIYESSSALWKNKSIATALGYTPANSATTLTINGVTYDLSTSRTWTISAGISGSGASGQVAYWDGTSSISGENNLFWDAANNRLGVVTNTPRGSLDVIGNFYLGSNTLFQDAGASTVINQTAYYPIILRTNNAERVRVFETGNFGIGTGSSDGGQRLQVQGTTLLNGNVTFSSSTGMFWDATNSRLGIGTNTPAVGLDVRNRLRVTGTSGIVGDIGSNTYGLSVQNNASSSWIEILNNGGTSKGVFFGITNDRTANTFELWNYQGGAIDFYNAAFATTGTRKLRIWNNGNVTIQDAGTYTDTGERLQVTGDVKITGSGATSGTRALTVQNSSNQNSIRVRNDGNILFGNSGNPIWAFTYSSVYDTIDINGTNLSIYPLSGSISLGGATQAQTSGNQNNVITKGRFQPTSGTATFTEIRSEPLINQTGGANGITRGLYVNPTLTSAADFRAIETARGNIVFGNLPTSSAGLPTGAIWNDAGTIKIV